MRVLASRLARVLLIFVLLLAPVAAHLALATRHGMTLAGLLVAVQAALVSWFALSSITRRALRAGICGAILLGILLLSRLAEDGPVVATGVPHAMTYLALLALFAASLQPGREAVITVLARNARGRLTAEMLRYTRRLTWVWCGFFLAQLVGSLTLLLFAPLYVWSLFINLCNVPLLVVMFCAEYAYRQWRHAARPPERLIDMVRVVRGLRTAPVGEDR
jgi:uncharacterized membrane protein